MKVVKSLGTVYQALGYILVTFKVKMSSESGRGSKYGERVRGNFWYLIQVFISRYCQGDCALFKENIPGGKMSFCTCSVRKICSKIIFYSVRVRRKQVTSITIEINKK